MPQQAARHAEIVLTVIESGQTSQDESIARSSLQRAFTVAPPVVSTVLVPTQRPGEAMETDFTYANALGVNHRWQALGAPAVSERAPVIKLGVKVDHGLPLRMDGRLARDSIRGVSPRAGGYPSPIKRITG
jgi:hypothetical protein